MSVRKGYNRYFIIFQEEDKGYGIAIDKQPTGYAKIEVRNGKCKITVYAQNIKQEKGPYNFCLIDTDKSPANVVKLGEVRIDEIGTGETFWEYSEDNIGGSGQTVENYNVAVLLADEEMFSAPLSGFTGKGKIPWKDKLTEEIGKANEMRNNPVEEDLPAQTQPEVELDEEAEKFREYELQIKNEAEKLNASWKDQTLRQTDKQQIVTEDDIIEEYEEQLRSRSHGKGHHKMDDCHGKMPKHKHHEMEEEESSSSHDHIAYEKCAEESSSSHDHISHEKYEATQEMCPKYQKMFSGKHVEGINLEMPCNEKDHDESSHDHNEHMKKHKEGRTYADVFHYLLSEFEEVTDKFTCHHMENTRWWKIPARYDEKMIEEKHYPFMCTIFHLSMAYPHIDYVKYFYQPGYYYFGMKYDDNDEVKYLMYGIPGHNNIREQPYMGMTGFNKWMGDTADGMGVWVMFYNPRTGNFMIEKNR